MAKTIQGTRVPYNSQGAVDLAKSNPGQGFSDGQLYIVQNDDATGDQLWMYTEANGHTRVIFEEKNYKSTYKPDTALAIADWADGDSETVTIGTDLDYESGDRIEISYDHDNYWIAEVGTYNSNTGAITFQITEGVSEGSDSFSIFTFDIYNPVVRNENVLAVKAVLKTYSALAAQTKFSPADGDIALVTGEEGTRWLPGSLGGSFRAAGLYIYNGTDDQWDYLSDSLTEGVYEAISNQPPVQILTSANVTVPPNAIVYDTPNQRLYANNSSNEIENVSTSTDFTVSPWTELDTGGGGGFDEAEDYDPSGSWTFSGNVDFTSSIPVEFDAGIETGSNINMNYTGQSVGLILGRDLLSPAVDDITGRILFRQKSSNDAWHDGLDIRNIILNDSDDDFEQVGVFYNRGQVLARWFENRVWFEQDVHLRGNDLFLDTNQFLDVSELTEASELDAITYQASTNSWIPRPLTSVFQIVYVGGELADLYAFDQVAWKDDRIAVIDDGLYLYVGEEQEVAAATEAGDWQYLSVIPFGNNTGEVAPWAQGGSSTVIPALKTGYDGDADINDGAILVYSDTDDRAEWRRSLPGDLAFTGEITFDPAEGNDRPVFRTGLDAIGADDEPLYFRLGRTNAGDGGATGEIQFLGGGSDGTAQLVEIRTDKVDSSNGRIEFLTRQAGALTRVLRLDNNGNALFEGALVVPSSEPAALNNGNIWYDGTGDGATNKLYAYINGEEVELGQSAGSGGIEQYSDSEVYTLNDVVWWSTDNSFYVWQDSENNSVAGTDPSDDTTNWVALSSPYTAGLNSAHNQYRWNDDEGNNLLSLNENRTNHHDIDIRLISSNAVSDTPRIEWWDDNNEVIHAYVDAQDIRLHSEWNPSSNADAVLPTITFETGNGGEGSSWNPIMDLNAVGLSGSPAELTMTSQILAEGQNFPSSGNTRLSFGTMVGGTFSSKLRILDDVIMQSYLRLHDTTTDGTSEGNVWYDTGTDEVKYRDGEGVKAVATTDDISDEFARLTHYQNIKIDGGTFALDSDHNSSLSANTFGRNGSEDDDDATLSIQFGAELQGRLIEDWDDITGTDVYFRFTNQDDPFQEPSIYFGRAFGNRLSENTFIGLDAGYEHISGPHILSLNNSNAGSDYLVEVESDVFHPRVFDENFDGLVPNPSSSEANANHVLAGNGDWVGFGNLQTWFSVVTGYSVGASGTTTNGDDDYTYITYTKGSDTVYRVFTTGGTNDEEIWDSTDEADHTVLDYKNY